MNERTRAALERAAAIKERREKGTPEKEGLGERTEQEEGGGGGGGGGGGKEEEEETKKDTKVAVEATPAVESKYAVGAEVMAMWAEDRLHYKARVDRVAADGQRYDITFLEYGNQQLDTHESWILTVEQVAEMAAASASASAAASSASEPVQLEVATVDTVESSGESPVSSPVVKPKKVEEEKWELSDAIIPPPPTSKSAQVQSEGHKLSKNKLVGRKPDGTPIYMSAEEEAELRYRKKQDKREKKTERKEKLEKATKKGIGLFRKKKDEDAPPPSVVPETTEWKQTTASSAPAEPDHGGSGTDLNSSQTLQHRKLSPRRAPPAPPKPATVTVPDEEKLEPLPPITAPAKEDDFLQCGHVFVCLGDLRRIHCDAWLIPTGRDYVPAQHWFIESNVRPRNYAGVGAAGLKYFGTKSKVTRAPGWPDPGRPYPYLVNTSSSTPDGQDAPASFEWLTGPVCQFLELATEELRAHQPERGRLKHLIALPVVGTGFGGMPSKKGDVIHALLPVLMEHAKNRNVDIVLVTNERPLWSALQHARRGMSAAFATLEGRLKAKADELARFARAGKLALFVGAGVSIGAGLPSWGGLMTQLMDEAKIPDASRAELKEMSFLDQARLLQDRLGGAESMAKSIAKRLQSVAYSISHSLLASMPVNSVVSTNFDTLFEDASRDAGRPCAVLPYEPSREADRFVLKMHGDVHHQDIVLTREDYLRYDNRKGALAGIVQSLLITNHMFFCGFSLTDDNFMKIVDQVRLAMSNHTSKLNKAFGSATFLHKNALFGELWSDIDMITMMQTGKDFPQAGNVLEIFLDFLSARTSSAESFILEPNFDALLGPEDAAFKQHLMAWLDSFPPESRKSQGFTILKNNLRTTFGGLKLGE